MTVIQVDVVHKLVQHLIQDYAAFAETDENQGEFEGRSGRHAELTLGMSLVQGVLQQCLDMREGSIPGAIGRDAHYGGLHEVVKAAEEGAQHATRADYPNSRAWELALEQVQGVLQAPTLPLADFLELGLHFSFQILHKGGKSIVSLPPLCKLLQNLPGCPLGRRVHSAQGTRGSGTAGSSAGLLGQSPPTPLSSLKPHPRGLGPHLATPNHLHCR